MKDFTYDDTTKCSIMPHLVIEVVSPSHTIYGLLNKASKFIKAGVEVVWTIEPYGKSIYITTTQKGEVQIEGIVETGGLHVDV